MLRPSLLVYFYSRRLRTHPVQEALAGLGIAIGVALVFAVQIANNSVVGSSSEIARAVTESADLQVLARDSRGFDAGVVDEIRAAPGVANAAAALQQRAVLHGPQGQRETVEIVGAGPDLFAITSGFENVVQLDRPGVLLPEAVADRLGVGIGTRGGVVINLRGKEITAPLGAVLGPENVGPIANAKLAVTALPYLQRMSGLEDRVSRVLIEAKPGQHAAAAAQVRSIMEGQATVASPDSDLRLLDQVTSPQDQATTFFAVMSGVVGLLLAFNAMLLTAPERRREIAELRLLGYRPRQIVQLVTFQATVLGVVASLVGLAVGLAIAGLLFEQAPGYLAAAFPLGTNTVIDAAPILLSVGCGVAATWLATAPLLFDLRRDRAVDAVYAETGVPGHELDARTRYRLLAAAVAVLAITGALFLITPSAAIAAGVGLGVATVLVMPTAFAFTLRAFTRLAERGGRWPSLMVALAGLRATTLRSLALAATGAVAVFGAVAVDGGHRDLLNGLYGSYWQYTDTADVWIVNPSDDLATKDIADGDGVAQQVAAMPGVTEVRPYYGGFFDVADRRTWLIARPATDRELVPGTEVVTGNLDDATSRLRGSGWITVSDQLADALGATIGDPVDLPTPTGPAAFRIAATTTNLGWTGGAIVMNSRDYRRAFDGAAPTGLEVDVAPTADPTSIAKQAQTTLATAAPGLIAQTTRARADQANALAREALRRLGEIAVLLLVAAALAMAAAMSTAIWQRRQALAELRVQGFQPPQLLRVLLLEFGFIVGIGCVVGAVAGIYGELLIDRYLSHATGFPAPFAPGVWQPVRTGILVVAVSLLAVATPGIIAARVPPRIALQE